jgi:hypothetical protein
VGKGLVAAPLSSMAKDSFARPTKIHAAAKRRATACRRKNDERNGGGGVVGE